MPLNYSSFITPVGNLAPTLNGSTFTAPFTNTATFTNDSSVNCSSGEYRQYVMGAFMVNGSVITHVLCGSTVMSSNVYQEDGCPSGSCTAYGHRSCPPSDLDKYMTGQVTDQATGCGFTMTDAPGFTNVSAQNSYTVNLSFQGSLIDMSNATTLVTRSWTVSGVLAATSPAVSSSAATSGKGRCGCSGLQDGDRIVAVHAARNLISHELEAHVVVTRPRHQPPLADDALALRLKDRHGHPIAIGDPEVHEVVCGDRATASFVHRIRDARRPVKAEVGADGLNVAFDVFHR